jgi:hypothetical protein
MFVRKCARDSRGGDARTARVQWAQGRRTPRRRATRDAGGRVHERVVPIVRRRRSVPTGGTAKTVADGRDGVQRGSRDLRPDGQRNRRRLLQGRDLLRRHMHTVQHDDQRDHDVQRKQHLSGDVQQRSIDVQWLLRRHDERPKRVWALVPSLSKWVPVPVLLLRRALRRLSRVFPVWWRLEREDIARIHLGRNGDDPCEHHGDGVRDDRKPGRRDGPHGDL